jgi:protein ImuB
VGGCSPVGEVMYAVLHPVNFFAQAAAHDRPELRKRSFVVLDGDPPEEFVFAANKQARLAGVELGMSRLQVEAFGILALRREHSRETTAQNTLHDVACTFSPRIEYVHDSPGTFALDIRGMSTIFGDPGQLAARLRQHVISRGFIANVATSENFHAAACLARGRSGVSIVPGEQEAEALSDLPLSVLMLEPEHAETFASWGIRTCGELAALKETDLIARVGQAGRRLHALASGTWSHLMAPVEPDFESGLTERMELETAIDDLERLLFLLSRMTTELLSRVQERARAIRSVRVMLHLDGDGTHERIVRPALPVQDTKTLLKLMQLDLEAHLPGAEILAVELQAQSAEPYRAQHGLFLPQAPEPGQTEVLLARLRKLLGEDRVGSPELTDDHRPNAFRMVTFAPPAPQRTENHSVSVPIALRVNRPPQAIGVQLTNDRPVRVYWNSTRYNVLEAAGPVRTSGHWWSEANWCREEWDVRIMDATAERVCRIAFDPRSRSWYLQGTYD